MSSPSTTSTTATTSTAAAASTAAGAARAAATRVHDAASVRAALDEARARTLAILAPVPDDLQRRQVSELMSPLCWDLADIGHYEELWLVRELAGADPTDPQYDDVYDAFRHPRRERVSLPILGPAEARAFVARVRARTLAVLDGCPADALAPGAPDPLLADAFVYGMVVQHEHQHAETMLATMQLATGFRHPDADGAPDPHPFASSPASPAAPAASPAATPAASRADAPDDVLVPGGTFVMGTSAEPWAYDNERPAHAVELAPFRIDTFPVANRAYAEFVAGGGYDDERLWTAAGWEWRNRAELQAPQFWVRDGGGGWARHRFGRVEDLPLGEPVQHVCWYEADAFARWAGARLPTEAEWERAAQGADPDASYLWPRGTDPATAHRFGPSPVGTRPESASDVGAQQMLGDVWEWTASDFTGYPGFSSFPYREYSDVFLGAEYKVLRGGSWATHPRATRATFRNWDFPIRRQIFAGFRCARDA